MSATLFPVVPQQWFGDSLPNAGGVIWIYERGTTTPATGAIWWDADGTIAGANPIVLDTAGRPTPTGAVYLTAGAYTVVMLDAEGAQIADPVDILVGGSAWGGGGETVNSGTAFIAKTYADVRNLTQAWDTVYVCGRIAEADGGQGWFQYDPLETGVDDDGVCLVAGSHHFVRQLDDILDPRWYGLKYNSIQDQTLYFLTTNTATTRWKRPSSYAGSTTLLQDTTVYNNQSVKVTGTGVFVSGGGTPVNMYFQGDSEFEATGITFGVDVQPKFAKDLIPAVPLSWMGGSTNEDRLDRWINCADETTNTHQVLLMDASFTCSSIPVVPRTYSVDVADAMITLDNVTDIDMDLIYAGDAQIFKFNNIAHISAVNLGNRPAKPEWFGARGDNSTPDNIAVQAAVKNQRVYLNAGSSYRVTQQLSIPAVVAFTGDLLAPMSVFAPIDSVDDVPRPRLFLDPPTSMDVLEAPSPCQLSLDGVGLALGGNAAVDTNSGVFNAVDSIVFATNASGTIKSTHLAMSNTVVNDLDAFTATGSNTYLDNVRDDSDYAKRKFHHDSSFKDIFLENEAGKSATYDNVLTTRNADGLVEGKNALRLSALTLDTVAVQEPEYTLIEVIAEFNIDHTSVRVKRDGVQIAFYDATPSYVVYDMQSGDKPMIVVQPKSSGASIGPIWTYIKPAALPSGAKVAEVVHAGVSGSVVCVGDIGGSTYCWNPGYVTLLDTSVVDGANHRVAQLRNVLGKWSVG